MSDDLVKRLRDWSEYDEGKINDAREEAADRIEALEAELVEERNSREVASAKAWEFRERIEALEAELKAAYANCREEVEKIKTDPYTEFAKHHVIQYSSITARDWMIAMAEDIDRAIKSRAAMEGKDG